MDKKEIKPPKKQAFTGQQLDIFRDMYVSNDAQRNGLSNSVELWDTVPRFSVTQASMNKMRDEKGHLEVMKIDFQYRQVPMRIVIQPARVEEEKDGVINYISYYPSANEELIEEALRRMATMQDAGFHEPQKRSGIRFTLYQLREELARYGHTRSFTQIVQSLEILSGSIIEIQGESNKKTYFEKSAYLPRISSVKRSEWLQDPEAKWYAEFHPLIRDAIDTISYRQIDYEKLMSHNSQLARWLHRYLVSRYTMAGMMVPFDIHFSTIRRDSAMLEGYRVTRQAVAACEEALQELVTQQIIREITRQPVTGPRGKILDVVYTIVPTADFVNAVKAANTRQAQSKALLEKP